jgi:hypothetical protein
VAAASGEGSEKRETWYDQIPVSGIRRGNHARFYKVPLEDIATKA